MYVYISYKCLLHTHLALYTVAITKNRNPWQVLLIVATNFQQLPADTSKK